MLIPDFASHLYCGIWGKHRKFQPQNMPEHTISTTYGNMGIHVSILSVHSVGEKRAAVNQF